jgi:hypothetical protein
LERSFEVDPNHTIRVKAYDARTRVAPECRTVVDEDVSTAIAYLARKYTLNPVPPLKDKINEFGFGAVGLP